MDLVYSLFIPKDEGAKSSYCGYICKEDLLNSMMLSFIVSSVHFDRTVLYCNITARDLVLSVSDRFEFDEIIVCLDGIDDWLESYNWAYTKVLVYSLQKTAFCHIDFDVFLWNGIPNHLLSYPFIVQSYEFINEKRHSFYNVAYDESKYMDTLPEIIDKPKFAFNMGVFCCTDTNYLPLLSEYHTLVYNYIIKTKDVSEKIKEKSLQSVLFEQLFIVSLFDNKSMKSGIDYVSLLDKNNNPLNGIRYTHLLASSKRDEKNIKSIKLQLELRGYKIC